MASISENGQKVPLGVGAIVQESFSILFNNFIPVLTMAFVPMLLGTLISAVLTGPNVALGIAPPDFSTTGGGVAWGLSLVSQVVFYGLATALLVQLAYDAKLGRPLQLGRYLSIAIRVAVPTAILLVISSILIGLGMLVLIIPGLWLYAVFSVVAPAVVIEGAGFGGLGRSAELTREYRWPVVGALILIGICTGIINFVAAFIVSLLAGAGGVVMMALLSLLAALGAGLAGISVALIYARLREIKEGVSVDQIASVFD